MSQPLSDWLKLLETRHPHEIELGLERISQVANRLNLGKLAPKTVTVAGTNGKGTCIAVLDSILRDSGFNVAVYTSPHLIDFNERICINGKQASDQAICDAFEQVEAARLQVPAVNLSYFEFTTLAAFLLIVQAPVDIALLEVGLGGRLDAVNIIDPDIAIITSIALDHEAWLGKDLDSIGREKAAIGRADKPLIYGDCSSVQGVIEEAQAQQAVLYKNGQVFSLVNNSFQGMGKDSQPVILNHLPDTNLSPSSVACALQALLLLGIDLNQADTKNALNNLKIPGRYQYIQTQGKTLLIDVAHNPAAAERLASMLTKESITGDIIGIFAVMDDKDIAGILKLLKPLVNRWILPELPNIPRAAKPQRLQTLLYNAVTASTIEDALAMAFSIASNDDLVLVCGSFYIAGPVLKLLGTSNTVMEENKS